jgi:uncharacterized protein (DUF433 family)
MTVELIVGPLPQARREADVLKNDLHLTAEDIPAGMACAGEQRLP